MTDRDPSVQTPAWPHAGRFAVGYSPGLALWSRLGALVRGCRVTVLVVLWAVLVMLWPTLVVLAAGGFAPEVALISVAAVYRVLRRDAAQRGHLVAELPLQGTRHVLAQEQRRAGAFAERERIARDPHDTLAQERAGRLMPLHAAERDPARRPGCVRARTRACPDACGPGRTGRRPAETRRIIGVRTPTAVAEAGLEGSLRLSCERARQEGTAGGDGRAGAVPLGGKSPTGAGRPVRHRTVPGGTEHAGERTGARTSHESAGHASPLSGPRRTRTPRRRRRLRALPGGPCRTSGPGAGSARVPGEAARARRRP